MSCSISSMYIINFLNINKLMMDKHSNDAILTVNMFTKIIASVLHTLNCSQNKMHSCPIIIKFDLTLCLSKYVYFLTYFKHCLIMS